MHKHNISNKLINDITFILNKRTDMNIYVDMLLFEEDKNKKQIMIDKLLNIEEIKNNETLSAVWRKLLNESL